MRPITVTVGPLASASTNNICTTQTPSAGNTFVMAGTLVTKTFQGTGSIASNTLTISAVTSGVLNIGDRLNGAGVAQNTVVMGILGTTTNGTGTYVVSVSQTVSSTTIYANVVATLDTPRRILMTPTGNESSNTLTITGTGPNGEPITEVLTGGNATATYTNIDFSTVTQIVAKNNAAAAIIVGTNGVASSRWINFDPYALASVGVQITVSGTVNYTLQQAIQGSTAASTLLPYQVTFVNCSDLTVVGATATQQTSYLAAPTYAKVTLNSGSGSITATFTQYGVAPF